MLKKAILVVSGNAFASIFLLLRNLIVARLMSPENYGIASTYAISMSVVEMLSYLGLNQLMVVDKDGDNPRFQAAMQGFQVLRGTFSAIVLFLIAYPYAQFLGVERVAWSYEILALIPFINGFQHYDVHRERRHMNFTPTVLVNSIPAFVSVLSLWPLALMFGDYRIMLFALFAQAISMVATTHLTAKRPYRLMLDFGLMKHAARFGWPLLLDGALIFGAFNGERLIVLRELGVTQFAFFSMAFTLTLTPTIVLANSFQSLFLPPLTAAREDGPAFQRLSIAAIESNLAVAVLLMMGTAIVGGPLAYLLLGPKYLSILGVLVPVAALQAIRIAKNGANIVALAIGKSSSSMWCNLIRVASLPLSWWVAVRSGDVFTIIWIVCVAEILAFALSMVLAKKWAGIRLSPLILPVGLSAALTAFAVYDCFAHPPVKSMLEHLHWGLLVTFALGLVSLLTMTGLRHFAVEWWRGRR
ncbi:MAG: oligosaccharide flippase family protein [Paracoccaceae bacterium]|jgi:O-antigen/teichoic acid export membrane protein